MPKTYLLNNNNSWIGNQGIKIIFPLNLHEIKKAIINNLSYTKSKTLMGWTKSFCVVGP